MYSATTNKHLIQLLHKVDVLMGQAEEVQGDKELKYEQVRDKICPEIIRATPGLESIEVARNVLNDGICYHFYYQYSGADLPYATGGSQSLNHQLAKMVKVLKSKGTCDYILPFTKTTTVRLRKKPKTFAELHGFIVELGSSKREFLAAVESELYKLANPAHKAIKRQSELLVLLLEDIINLGVKKWEYDPSLQPGVEALYMQFVRHSPEEAQNEQSEPLRQVLHRYVWDALLEVHEWAFLHYEKLAGAKKATQYSLQISRQQGIEMNSLGINWKQNPPTVAPQVRPRNDPNMLKPRRRVVLLHYFQGDLGEAINSPKVAEALFLSYGDKGPNLGKLVHKTVNDWSDEGKIKNTAASQVVNGLIADLKYIKQYLTESQQEKVDSCIDALESKRRKKQG